VSSPQQASVTPGWRLLWPACDPPGLVIYSVYDGYWFWGRPSFEDLRRDLREVTREIRPDWDLAAPGLRENWDAGGHTMHHPYQQTDHVPVTPRSVRNH